MANPTKKIRSQQIYGQKPYLLIGTIMEFLSQ